MVKEHGNTPLLPLTLNTNHGACEQGVEHEEGRSGGDDAVLMKSIDVERENSSRRKSVICE